MGTTPAIFDSSTVSTTKTLGVVMNSSDKEPLKMFEIEDFHWIEGVSEKSISHLFYSMRSEWDLVVFPNALYLGNAQIKLLLEAIRENPEKSLCFLDGGFDTPDRLIIDSSNIDKVSDLTRLKIRNEHDLELAIYADTTDDKRHALAQLHEGGDELADFKTVKIFGALSEDNPWSTIDDAINFVCKKPNRVLAMSHLSEFNRNPIEIQKVFKKIDDAESSVCIRFFHRDIVEWLWKAENAGRTPFSFFGGNNLSRLIRGLEPVASYYFHNPYAGENNGSTKLEGREYRLIQIYMKEGKTQEQIAEKLGVSRATIGRHVSKMRKAGLL